ncbi:MAG: DNA-binding response regulator [Ramlibacter sp.]|nr:DNA-binding response regulator [Ramlibacter sp.]
MRLLLVEDDRDMVSWLSLALKQSGFVTDLAPDARTAEALLAAGTRYDAIVLDLGLPDRHGFTVLSRLRDARDSTPVLLLTAQAALPDRVRGLNLGADDFLAKPFAIEELEARLTALIRRSHGHGHSRLECGSLAYDSENRGFSLGGQLMSVTPREHAALTALLMRAGSVVDKSQLSGKVFPQDSNVGPDAIELVLHRVRRKLAGSDVRVVTVRGLGYMLEKQAGAGDADA